MSEDHTQYIKQLENQIEELKVKIRSLQNELVVSKKELLTVVKLESKNQDEQTKDLKLEVIEANTLAKIADSASIAKNTFLANIGHELRTPLHNIMGSVNILLNQNNIIQKDQKEYLDIIDQKSRDLLVLVNDLLDISKIEAGKLSLNYETVKLWHLIKEVNKSFENEIRNKKLKYRVDIGKNIPKYLVIDPFRLKQILINLIGNAIKFTDRGSVKIYITRSFNEDLENSNRIELEVCVSDTGIGIPKQQQSQLFKPFSQVQDLTHKQYGGTGLGLAIAKRLVEIMGGKIWIEDNIPNGARFCFTIIASKIEEKRNFSTIMCNDYFENKAKEVLNKRTLCLMIVEDDIISLDILKIIIKQKNKNIIITSANNGQQAVEIYKQGIVDMILTDIQMPLMDGFSMIQQIRAIEDNSKHTPILAMTASAGEKDKKRCLQAGADFYITKPVIREDLYQTLDKMIEKFYK
jgi:signal transduction histidine kinase/CheY-like chemotaxis protein